MAAKVKIAEDVGAQGWCQEHEERRRRWLIIAYTDSLHATSFFVDRHDFQQFAGSHPECAYMTVSFIVWSSFPLNVKLTCKEDAIVWRPPKRGKSWVADKFHSQSVITYKITAVRGNTDNQRKHQTYQRYRRDPKVGMSFASWFNPKCGIEVGLRSRRDQESCSRTESEVRGGALMVILIFFVVEVGRRFRRGDLTREQRDLWWAGIATAGGFGVLAILIGKFKSNGEWYAVHANLDAAMRDPERAKFLHEQHLADGSLRSAVAAEHQVQMDRGKTALKLAQQIHSHYFS